MRAKVYPNREDAEARERELFSTARFLDNMKDLSAEILRISEDRSACTELVKSFARKEPIELKIQEGHGGF